MHYPRRRIAANGPNPLHRGCGGDAGLDPLAYEVHKEHLNHRQIILTGEVTSSVIEKVVMQIEKFNYEDEEAAAELRDFDRQSRPVTIYINSPGGRVLEGMAVVSAIEQSVTPIVTVAMGQACSMAFMILISGHARFAFRHAEIMYHQLSAGVCGTETSISRASSQFKRTQERIDEIVLRRTHITPKMLKEVNEREQDWYMWPEEALRLGVIDGIAPVGLSTQKQSKKYFEELADTYLSVAKKGAGKKGGK